MVLTVLIETLLISRSPVRLSMTPLGNHRTQMRSRSLYPLERSKPLMLYVPPVTNDLLESPIRSY